MDSSKEIKPKKKRGSLVCKDCGGYYELQEGESADDFDSCECGGKLIHNNPGYSDKTENINDYASKIESIIDDLIPKLSFKALSIGFIICLVLLIIAGSSDSVTIVLFISSLIVGYIIYEDYIAAALNSSVLAILPIIYMMFKGSLHYVSNILGTLIWLLFLGAVAGIIGATIRKKILNTQ